jgi:hypothetical protein
LSTNKLSYLALFSGSQSDSLWIANSTGEYAWIKNRKNEPNDLALGDTEFPLAPQRPHGPVPDRSYGRQNIDTVYLANTGSEARRPELAKTETDGRLAGSESDALPHDKRHGFGDGAPAQRSHRLISTGAP